MIAGILKALAKKNIARTGLGNQAAQLILKRARDKKLKRIYRGDTLYPEKKLISTTGIDEGQRPGSWFSDSHRTAQGYAYRPTKSYQDESGKSFLMGFNPNNPGVIRRVDLDLGFYGNKHKYKIPSSNTPSGFEYLPFYNLPEEEAAKGVISLLHTFKSMNKSNFKKKDMIKAIFNILKSGEKIRPFNRGGIASL